MKMYDLDISEELMCELIDKRLVSMPTMVFEMTEEVDLNGLKYASDIVMRKHPYFKTRLIKQGISFKLEENNEEFPIREATLSDIIEFGGRENGNYQWMLTYNGNKIYVDVSHYITDGSGAQAFASELIEYYANYLEGKIEDDIQKDEKKIEAECALPSDIAADPSVKPFFRQKEWHAAKFKENVFTDKDSEEFVLFSISLNEVKKAAKRAEVSPFAVFAPLLAHAVKVLVTPEENSSSIGVMFPFSARKLFNATTFHNFVPTRTIIYDYDKLSKIDVELASTVCRAQMDLLTQKEDVIVELTQKAMARAMLSNDTARATIIQQLNNAIHNPSQITFTFMSQSRLSDVAEKHLTRNYFATNASRGINYVICTGINDGKSVHLSIPRNFESEEFYNQLREEFNDTGIVYEEELIKYPCARFSKLAEL